jgi:hypothetical protein
MGRDKRNNQGRLTEKKLSRAKQEDVDKLIEAIKGL